MLRSFTLAVLLFARVATAAVMITDPGHGIFDFTGPAPGLSGLTYLGSNDYYAVSDSVGAPDIHPLTVNLNPATGAIASASLGPAFPLATGGDPEGIALHPLRGTLFISDEGLHPDGGYIREFNRSTGALIRTVSIPAVLLRDRRSLGFESLSYGAGALWTANEQALEHETTVQGSSGGTVVRLQKFNDALAPAGQWAYSTDASAGVADLLALPDGNLLALERASGVGDPAGFRNRIYLINFAGATDVSGIDDLDDGDFTFVNKSLLWERHMGNTGTHNFEGIALGPSLGDERFSVLLIADNGSGSQQHLYPLILTGMIPEPSTAALLCTALLGFRWRQHEARHDRSRPS